MSILASDVNGILPRMAIKGATEECIWERKGQAFHFAAAQVHASLAPVPTQKNSLGVWKCVVAFGYRSMPIDGKLDVVPLVMAANVCLHTQFL